MQDRERKGASGDLGTALLDEGRSQARIPASHVWLERQGGQNIVKGKKVKQDGSIRGERWYEARRGDMDPKRDEM